MRVKVIFIFLVFVMIFVKNLYSMELVTKKGNFIIKFAFTNAKITTGINNAKLEVYDRNNNPVDSAKIEILLWMVEHGHYSSATPVIKEIEPGIYEISKLDFEMKGRWELIINIKKDKIKDRVSFDIVVE